MKHIFILLFTLTFISACSQNEGCKTIGDKKNGRYVEYYTDCKKKTESYYKNGTYDGTYVEWNEDGTVNISGQFRSGKKEGRWRHNGVLSNGGRAKNFMFTEYLYEAGRLKSAYDYLATTYDSLSPKRSETFITYGKDTIEKSLVYHDNGRLAGENYMINGRIDSVSKAWDEDGRLFAENHHKKSRAVKDINYHKAYTEIVLYKNGFKNVRRQYDLAGKLLYEAYYDRKGRTVKATGKEQAEE